MKKKIASEFAIGVILLVAIAIGTISWLQSAKQLDDEQNISQSLNLSKVKKYSITNSSQKDSADDKTVEKQDDSACKAHYYEGETVVHAWLSSEEESDGSVIVQIKPEDAKKLPMSDVKTGENLTIKLIDPTDEIRKDLNSATSEKPAEITIKGYADVCQQPPLASIEQATIAFKKS